MKSFYSKRIIKLLLFDKQRGRCNACREPFTIAKLELDHIIPRAGGGSDIPSNFQLLCKPCNVRKCASIDHGTQYGLFDVPREPRHGGAPKKEATSAPKVRGRAMTEAEKKRSQRERARTSGKCIVCRKQGARDGKSTCGPCNEAAKARVRKRREAAKS